MIAITFGIIKTLLIIEFMIVATKYISTVNNVIITISPIGKDSSLLVLYNIDLLKDLL